MNFGKFLQINFFSVCHILLFRFSYQPFQSPFKPLPENRTAQRLAECLFISRYNSETAQRWVFWKLDGPCFQTLELEYRGVSSHMWKSCQKSFISHCFVSLGHSLQTWCWNIHSLDYSSISGHIIIQSRKQSSRRSLFQYSPNKQQSWWDRCAPTTEENICTASEWNYISHMRFLPPIPLTFHI